VNSNIDLVAFKLICLSLKLLSIQLPHKNEIFFNFNQVHKNTVLLVRFNLEDMHID